jgi:predicted phosphodiesterase
MARRPLIADVVASLPQPAPAADAEQVTKRTDGDNVEARSVSRTIRTVEDLLRHIEADLGRYEVAQSEATKWEGMSVNRETGRPEVTELFRVFVRLKPRPGPGVRECVEAMISSASKDVRVRGSRTANKPSRKGAWAVLVVADTHFGKYCWEKTTGEADYDLDIAAQLVDESAGELLAIADGYKPGRMTIGMLGDLFHYDRPDGSTTSGTPLERDGRLQKMIEVGTDSLIGVIDDATGVGPADVVVVNGNHDETLTWALHRLLVERYQGRGRVRIDEKFTPRKYLDHGRNLLGFVHGHRAKRKLPQLMAIEAAKAWARCPYREIHTGHLHHQAAEWSRPIETLDGVLVRVAPSLGPADDYHAVNGWLGQRRAMELFIYDEAGGLVAMHVAGPQMEAPA